MRVTKKLKDSLEYILEKAKGIGCEGLDHGRFKDYHTFEDPCPVEKRISDHSDALREFIIKLEKQK